MPLLAIRTSATISDDDARSLLTDCSKKLATFTGKPESYVMTMLDRVPVMTMAGSAQPACWIEIRGVGRFSGEQTRVMSQAFGELIGPRLGVDIRRIYLNFIEFEASMWGYNGSTFG